MSQRLDRQLVLSPAPATMNDAVLRATYDSIMEVGVRRTTLADVARRAGVSRMTVYRKYDDLSRLLSALLTVELGAIFETAIEDARDLPHARARLAHLVASTCGALTAHPVFARVLSLDPEVLLPLIVDRIGSTQRNALELNVEMIKSGQLPKGDGSIRPGDPDVMALAILMAGQSFVFSSRAIATADPLGHIFPEIEIMTSRYLEPSSDEKKTSSRKRAKK